jgi:hypothetical protein
MRAEHEQRRDERTNRQSSYAFLLPFLIAYQMHNFFRLMGTRRLKGASLQSRVARNDKPPYGSQPASTVPPRLAP